MNGCLWAAAVASIAGVLASAGRPDCLYRGETLEHDYVLSRGEPLLRERYRFLPPAASGMASISATGSPGARLRVEVLGSGPGPPGGEVTWDFNGEAQQASTFALVGGFHLTAELSAGQEAQLRVEATVAESGEDCAFEQFALGVTRD